MSYSKKMKDSLSESSPSYVHKSRVIPTDTEINSIMEFRELGITIANVRSRARGALQNHGNGGKCVVCSVRKQSTAEKEQRPRAWQAVMACAELLPVSERWSVFSEGGCLLPSELLASLSLHHTSEKNLSREKRTSSSHCWISAKDSTTHQNVSRLMNISRSLGKVCNTTFTVL